MSEELVCDDDGRHLMNFSAVRAVISSDGKTEWTEKDFARLESKIDKLLEALCPK